MISEDSRAEGPHWIRIQSGSGSATLPKNGSGSLWLHTVHISLEMLKNALKVLLKSCEMQLKFANYLPYRGEIQAEVKWRKNELSRLIKTLETKYRKKIRTIKENKVRQQKIYTQYIHSCWDSGCCGNADGEIMFFSFYWSAQTLVTCGSRNR